MTRCFRIPVRIGDRKPPDDGPRWPPVPVRPAPPVLVPT